MAEFDGIQKDLLQNATMYVYHTNSTPHLPAWCIYFYRNLSMVQNEL